MAKPKPDGLLRKGLSDQIVLDTHLRIKLNFISQRLYTDCNLNDGIRRRTIFRDTID
jgi:hypothetical protein